MEVDITTFEGLQKLDELGALPKTINNVLQAQINKTSETTKVNNKPAKADEPGDQNSHDLPNRPENTTEDIQKPQGGSKSARVDNPGSPRAYARTSQDPQGRPGCADRRNNEPGNKDESDNLSKVAPSERTSEDLDRSGYAETHDNSLASAIRSAKAGSSEVDKSLVGKSKPTQVASPEGGKARPQCALPEVWDTNLEVTKQVSTAQTGARKEELVRKRGESIVSTECKARVQSGKVTGSQNEGASSRSEVRSRECPPSPTGNHSETETNTTNNNNSETETNTTNNNNSETETNTTNKNPQQKPTKEEINKRFAEEPYNKINGAEALPTSCKRVIMKYDIFAKDGKASVVKGYEAEINLKPGAMPVQSRIFKQSKKDDEIIRKWVEENLQQGLVEPSEAPWRANIICIPKKGNKTRQVADFRKHNKLIKPVSWPLPTVQDLLDEVAGSKYISTMDLKSAYHQIPVREKDRDVLTFCTRDGCFRYAVLPMGICIASFVYQEFIDKVLGNLKYKRSPANISMKRAPDWNQQNDGIRGGCAVAYQDDVCCKSETLEGHLDDLEAIFQRLEEYNCKLAPEKCQFFRNEVVFLGNVVSSEGVKPDPVKVQAVEAFTLDRLKAPRDIKVFLHTVGYMRRFIAGFAQIAAPLTRYTRKGVKFRKHLEGDQEAQNAFEELKRRLKTAPILVTPDFTKPWEIACDGSKHGIAGALFQRREDGTKAIVMYASRALRGATPKNPKGGEHGYHSSEWEVLAVLFCLEVFREYTQGTHIRVYNDASGLKNLPLRCTGRTTRRAARLMEFSFEVLFVPGKKNSLPDGMSRYPIKGESIYNIDPIELLNSITPRTQKAKNTITAIANERKKRARKQRSFLSDEQHDFRKTKRTRLTAKEKDIIRQLEKEEPHAPQDPEPRQEEAKDPEQHRKIGEHPNNQPEEHEHNERQHEPEPEGDRDASIQYPSTAADKMTTETFVTEQIKDKKCVAIRKVLAAPTPGPNESQQMGKRKKAIEIKRYFFEKNELLMRRHKPIDLKDLTEEEIRQLSKRDKRKKLTQREKTLNRIQPIGRIVAPKSLQAEILYLFHGIPLT